MTLRPSIFALAATALLSAACSQNPAVEDNDGGDNDAGHADAGNNDAGNIDAGNADAGTPDAGSCSAGRTFGGGEAKLAASSVTAVLVDETGAAVAAGQPLYICGLDICSDPGMTTASATTMITTSLTEKKPAFKYGDTINYAEFAIPLAAGSTDFTASGTGKLATGKLSDKVGATLTPGTSAVSGPVTVALPANADVEINTLVYGTADQQKLRAVSIPLTNTAPIFANDAGTPTDFKLLFGLAPSETTICPPAAVTVAVPSSLGWAPGTAVEFWVMTTDVGQTFAPYAGWAKISDGVVGSDGTTATTLPGQGFYFLENFAVRLK